jgi:hypothetical protein
VEWIEVARWYGPTACACEISPRLHTPRRQLWNRHHSANSSLCSTRQWDIALHKMPHRAAEERDWITSLHHMRHSSKHSQTDQCCQFAHNKMAQTFKMETCQFKVSRLLDVLQLGPRCTDHFAESRIQRDYAVFFWETVTYFPRENPALNMQWGPHAISRCTCKTFPP